MKNLLLGVICSITLTGCLFVKPLDRDNSISWNGINSRDGMKEGTNITPDNNGEFRIKWKSETAKVSMFLIKDIGAVFNRSVDEIIAHENTVVMGLQMQSDNSSERYLDCKVDSSLVEIRCQNESLNVDSGYLGITHLYNELPTDVWLEVTFERDRDGTYVKNSTFWYLSLK